MLTMWQTIARIILKNRPFILLLIAVVTAFMAYRATTVQVRYDFASLLPVDDPDLVAYRDFKEQFGEDGAMMVIGIHQPRLFEMGVFNTWYDLGQELKGVEGIDQVISVARCMNIRRNDTLRKFDFLPIVTERPASQATVDSIRHVLEGLPFYRHVLWNPDSMSFVMAVTISPDYLDNKKRIELSERVHNIALGYEESLEAPLHFSGLPFIRSVIAQMVQTELRMFMFLAAAVTALIMLLFFRSFKVVFFSMLVVGIAVVWAFGIISLLGYKLSILTGLIPPVLIVLGIANCIFLLNKYHSEFRAHGNKIKALQRMVRKIGNATLLTNATTASGFVTFAILESQVMREFGIVASLSIMGVFLASLLLIPVVFSYLPSPNSRHIRHLDRRTSRVIVTRFIQVVQSHRSKIYWVAGIMFIIALHGMTKVQTTGNLVDDLPDDNPVLSDLRWFESQFGGVMPFEVRIDALKPDRAISAATLRRIDQLQDSLAAYDEFARPVSMVEVIKFTKQGYYGGMESKYALPSNSERGFILSYDGGEEEGTGLLHTFIDSTRQVTRVSVQMKDIGTEQMSLLLERIRPMVDSVFPHDRYEVLLTGTAVVFTKGTEYLVKNLFVSLAVAIAIIAFIMLRMFRSWRMVLVSLVPNLFPLIITAALMGYFGITIKPSTILVFSIALGISVDDTIHFLAKYRQELEVTGWSIRRSVMKALREVGVSMIYTSVVLFFGFAIFTASAFGGTKALGLLVSITLLVAMFSNLLILPALLLTFEKSLTTEEFKADMEEE